jgi:recombination protein RecA
MTRERLNVSEETVPAKGGAAKKKAVAPRAVGTPRAVEFLPSGCTLLDKALGGGWALRRIANVVGDSSAGKTLLAMEAAANFAAHYPRGRIKYDEAEAAFDPRYAASLGMPLDRIEFGHGIDTVEDFFEDMAEAVKVTNVPQLVILDSLDALSDRAEAERDMDEATYGTSKARKLSELFRRLAQKMERSNLTLLIISQVRDKIGVTFGRKTTRSGGRALTFYCSQIVMLAKLSTINRTIDNVRRPIALEVLAKVDKNKVGPPLREVKFKLDFGYGIDDLVTCMTWLKEVDYLGDVGIKDSDYTKFISRINKSQSEREYRELLAPIQEAVRKRWDLIENGFLPRRRKYNGSDD